MSTLTTHNHACQQEISGKEHQSMKLNSSKYSHHTLSCINSQLMVIFKIHLVSLSNISLLSVHVNIMLHSICIHEHVHVPYHQSGCLVAVSFVDPAAGA